MAKVNQAGNAATNGTPATTTPSAENNRPVSTGPYTVIDADNGHPIRFSRYGDLRRAFSAADTWAYAHPDKDYIVLDAHLNPVSRPHAR